MALIKHETFNIYGDEKEIEALQDTIIVENNRFVEKFNRESIGGFGRGVGGYDYLNLGNYNGKAVQLVKGEYEIVIFYDGKIIGQAFNTKKNKWVVYIYDDFDTTIVNRYEGKEGVKGRNVVLYALMNDTRTMIETYADAYQYYHMQYEDMSMMGIEDDYDAYAFYNGISTGECTSCRGGGCVHCEPNRFIV